MCKDQPTILLADDDADDQELLKDAMFAIDPSVQVQLFNNGQEIIEYLNTVKEPPPCLIVLDYNMPLVNGLQVLERISHIARLNSIPKIVWSTSASSLYKEECMKTGALKYIVKPNNAKGILQVATEMMHVCNGKS